MKNMHFFSLITLKNHARGWKNRRKLRFFKIARVGEKNGRRRVGKKIEKIVVKAKKCHKYRLSE